MQVFIAKNILKELPACWENGSDLPLNPVYRDNLKDLDLIVVKEFGKSDTPFRSIRRSELGERFLNRLNIQDAMKSELTPDGSLIAENGVIPYYVELEKALEIFGAMEKYDARYAEEWESNAKDLISAFEAFNDINDVKEKIFKDKIKNEMKKESPFKREFKSKKFSAKKNIQPDPEFDFKAFMKRFRNFPLPLDILNDADSNVKGFFIFHEDDDDDM